MTTQGRARLTIDAHSKPAFTRFSRLHEDRARERFVILAPERAYEIDAISLAVLRLIDGERPSPTSSRNWRRNLVRRWTW